MDPLDEIVSALRVREALYARLETAAPWGVRFAAGQAARFGLVVAGGCWLRAEGLEAPVRLQAGDCYVLVRGSTYALSDHPGSPTQNCFDVIGHRVGGIVHLGGSGAHGSDEAVVVTGWFTFDEAGARPLMALLPLLLHARMDRARTEFLQSTLDLLATETAAPGPGSGAVVSSLANMMLVQAIRSHLQDLPEGSTGLLTALTDPRLAASLSALHGDPADSWTVERLAERAGMSRSAFADRFRACLGEPPLEYLTRWRMFRAGLLLRRTQTSLAEIAAAIGYESDASFSKAFRRWHGMSPGAWRQAQAQPATAASAAMPRAAA